MATAHQLQPRWTSVIASWHEGHKNELESNHSHKCHRQPKRVWQVIVKTCSEEHRTSAERKKISPAYNTFSKAARWGPAQAASSPSPAQQPHGFAPIALRPVPAAQPLLVAGSLDLLFRNEGTHCPSAVAHLPLLALTLRSSLSAIGHHTKHWPTSLPEVTFVSVQFKLHKTSAHLPSYLITRL